MPITRFFFALVMVGTVIGQSSVWARILPDGSYEKLWHDADVVVIIEPLETEKNDDTLQIPWSPREQWQGLTTHFKIHAVFKGGPLAGELIVKHFDYRQQVLKKATVITDWPQFIRFTPGPLAYNETISKDGKAISHPSRMNQTPMYLAFLKRTPGKTYVAATGQVDPALSFKELRDVYYVPEEY